MKVLLINGSPRERGNTYIALSEVAHSLQEEGIESEIIWIGNRPVRGCIACNSCRSGQPHPDGHTGCVFNDDLCNIVGAKSKEADGFVFGSPVYYGQPNGSLLSLMQRLFYSHGDAFRGKPAAAITVCRRGGATAALQCLLMPMQILNMPIVTSQYWNFALGREIGQIEKDAEGIQTMRTLGKNFSKLLKGLK